MSTTTTANSSQLPETVQDLPQKQQRIYAYLAENVDSNMYFKSRLIGEQLDLSAKEVGTNLKPLLDTEMPLDIEKWGYSSGTTWKVTQSNS